MAALTVPVLAVAILSGCSRSKTTSDSGAKPKEVLKAKVHFYTGYYADVFEIGEKYGFWRDAGIEIERLFISPDQLGAAIESGQIDFFPIAYAYHIPIAAKGLKAKFIVANWPFRDVPAADGVWVKKSSGIKTQKDLIGKTIGTTNISWVGTWYVNAWLQKGGVAFDQVKFVNIPEPQQAQALQQGSIDALFTYAGVTAAIVAKEGGSERIFKVKDLFGDRLLPSGGVAVRDQLIKENPELVRRFVKGWVKANDYANDHLKEVVDYGVSSGKLTPKWTAPYIYGTDYSQKQFVEHALQDPKDVEFWVKFVEGQKDVIPKGSVKAEDIFTNEFNPYSPDYKYKGQ